LTEREEAVVAAEAFFEPGAGDKAEAEESDEAAAPAAAPDKA
jgi:hypothetical protein